MTKKNRNIGLLILFLLLALVAIIVFTYREKTFNIVELGKENAVLNRTDKPYLDTIVSVGLSELGIAGITVLIDPLEKELITGEFEIQAHIIGTQNQFIIFTNEFSREKALEVIKYCLKVMPDNTIPYDATISNFVDILLKKAKKINQTIPHRRVMAFNALDALCSIGEQGCNHRC